MKESSPSSSNREKVVIVSNFISTLNDVVDLIHCHGWSFLRLDGSTPVDKRQSIVDSFNQVQDPSMIFLLSSKAGGVGINLLVILSV